MVEKVLYILDTGICNAEEGKGIYLVKMMYQNKLLKWRLPGGWKRASETPEDAFLRIVKAQTGVELKHNDFDFHESMEQRGNYGVTVFGASVDAIDELYLERVENIHEWKLFTMGQIIEEIRRMDGKRMTEVDWETLMILLTYFDEMYRPPVSCDIPEPIPELR